MGCSGGGVACVLQPLQVCGWRQGGHMKADDELDLLPVEVAGIVGGVARRVPDATGRPADSMLAVYKDRLTYTFILEAEVASIHFDSRRQEIFFRGHNIRFM